MTRKLLTAVGYNTLKDELTYLIRKHRPEITEIVSWAASLGDRSENADYTYNKRKLREIDRRIRFLTKLFDVAEAVNYDPVQEGKVYFGAWCELENDDGETLRFRTVGDEEVYGRKDYISLKSPMAKACLGKTIDEEITVKIPSGESHWYIIKIWYNCSEGIESPT